MMLSVERIQTFYGQSHVLHGVSLTLAAGQIVAVVGRNGMGKTTLVRSVAGLTPTREGTITYRGRQIQGLAPHVIARMRMALVPQGRRIFPSLTVEENLLVAARGSGGGGGGEVQASGHWDIDSIYELFPQLTERRRHRGAELSGGEQQMLAIGRALMTNPLCLLMDEPSEGLAPLLVDEVGRILLGLKEQGLSVLLVEQNLPLVLRVADVVHVLSKGQFVFTGSPDALQHAPEVLGRHLALGSTTA